MDYPRWTEIQQQQVPSHQSASSASDQYPQYYNAQAQPYNPYPYYPQAQPQTHSDSATALQSVPKQPQTGPGAIYHHDTVNPLTALNNPSTHYDLGHSDAALRPPGIDSYAPALNSYAPQVGIEGSVSYQMGTPMGSGVPVMGYCQDPSTHHWSAKEAIRQYGSNPVIYESTEKPLSGVAQNQTANLNMIPWNSRTYPGPFNGYGKHFKRTKVVQSAWCAVCKIDCNSKDVLDKHKLGKKHKRNLQKLEEAAGAAEGGLAVAPALAQAKPKKFVAGGKKETAPAERGQTGGRPIQQGKRKAMGCVAGLEASAPGVGIETKRRKLLDGGTAADSVRVCEICNTVVNSQTVFDFHLSGKKHAAQVKKRQAAATAWPGIGHDAPRVMSTSMIWSNRTAYPASINGAIKKRFKKTKVAQSAWCEVCKIDCNSKDMLEKHKAGKKHKINLLKEPAPDQKKDATTTGAGDWPSGPAANSCLVQTKPVKDQAMAGKVENGSSEAKAGKAGKVRRSKKARVALAATDEDLETKQRKMVECGTAAESLRVCALCNMVFNSQKVFDFHLAGKKHIAQVKKHESGAGSDAPLVFSGA